jgi:Domain of unknown function (DUF4192)
MEPALDVPPLREVVAHAWFTMGYPPVHSLVVVGVESAGSGFVARVDLPAPEYRSALAGVMTSAACRAALRSVVVLVVLDPSGNEPPALDRAGVALVTALRSGMRRAGIRVLDVAVVGGGRYRSVDCRDRRCCPPGGRSLGDLRTTRTAAAMVLRGRTLVDDESALVEDVEPHVWAESVQLPSDPRRPLADLRRWQGMVAARLAAADGGSDPAPEEVVWLVPALEDVRFRDAALVALLPGGERVARALARGAPTSPAGFGSCEERSPDADVFEAGRVLLAAVARGAPPGRRAEALAVLAWMSWWQGVGARSRLLAALALRDRPGHRLAGLVDTLLLHGVPPRWVPLGTAVEAAGLDEDVPAGNGKEGKGEEGRGEEGRGEEGEDEEGLPGQGCGRWNG